MNLGDRVTYDGYEYIVVDIAPGRLIVSPPDDTKIRIGIPETVVTPVQ